MLFRNEYRKFFYVIFAFIVLLQTYTVTLSNSQEVKSLELGKSLERELKGNQKHTYQLKLSQGELAKIKAEQTEIDIAVEVISPDGKQLMDVDNSPLKSSPEKIILLANSSGEYKLIIRLSDEKTSGQYKIILDDLHIANDKDRNLFEAETLLTEAQKLKQERKYDEALSKAEKSASIIEKEIGTETAEYAGALNEIGDISRSKRDYTKAEPLLKRSLEIYERVSGAESYDAGIALNNLGFLYYEKNEYTKAEPYYLRSLKIEEREFGNESPRIVGNLNNLSAMYLETGEFSKAETNLKRSLAIREKTSGPESREMASALNNLAAFYYETADFQTTEALVQRSLIIYTKLFGEEHEAVANVQNNLASVNHALGDYAKSESLFLKSLETYEKKDKESLDVAATLSNLANVYNTKGDLTKAEEILQRALAIREKALGSEHPAVATTLNNLAEIYNKQGNYEKAILLHQRALQIRIKRFTEEHPAVANSLGNLGDIYKITGDYVKAESSLLRALEISEKKLGPEHRDVAILLNGLGILYRAKGDYEKSESSFQRSLKITEKRLGAENPGVAFVLNNLSGLYEAKGDYEKALECKTKAFFIKERNLALNVYAGSERQKLVYLSTFIGDVNTTISLHTKSMPQSEEAKRLALSAILGRKGKALDVMADVHGMLRSHASDENKILIDQYAETTKQLSAFSLKGPGREGIEKYKQNIKALEEKKEKLEIEISNRNAEFLGQTKLVTIDDVQRAIPKDAALIEFAIYNPFNQKNNDITKGYEDARYVAYVLRPEGKIEWKDIGTVKSINSVITDFRQALRDPERKDVGQIARAIDEKVMKPLRPLLGDTKHLLVSPDGSLNLIPFEAFSDEKGSYLIENYSVTYLSSGRDLIRLQTVRQSKSNPLVLADPVFGESASVELAATQPGKRRRSVTTGSNISSVYFAPLSGTSQEAQAIKTLFPESVVLTKSQAVESALKKANAPRILHIATHGFFLDDAPIDGGANSNQKNKIAMIENPLLRSGLAFANANANARTNDKGEDGIFTALEATGLNLWGTKLVVLSACDTGIGEVKNGEGVYGLRRSFVLAGTESLVMSLWSVSDYVTREMMTNYYKGLKQGLGRGEALRQTQLVMLKRKERQHPFYWASFIQSGDWANLDGKR